MSIEKLYLDLNQVRSEFEAWRAARTGREPTPKKLWLAAVKLLDYYPIKIVCRELRLNPTRLQKYRQGLSEVQPTESKNRKKEQFLELSPNSLISAKSKDTQSLPSHQTEQASEAIVGAGDQVCRLVLEKKDSSRLTISLPLDWSRIEALCANLLRA
jgi:hypothetical protein